MMDVPTTPKMKNVRFFKDNKDETSVADCCVMGDFARKVGSLFGGKTRHDPFFYFLEETKDDENNENKANGEIPNEV
jgi:hypothetical protein